MAGRSHGSHDGAAQYRARHRPGLRSRDLPADDSADRPRAERGQARQHHEAAQPAFHAEREARSLDAQEQRFEFRKWRRRPGERDRGLAGRDFGVRRHGLVVAAMVLEYKGYRYDGYRAAHGYTMDAPFNKEREFL